MTSNELCRTIPPKKLDNTEPWPWTCVEALQIVTHLARQPGGGRRSGKAHLVAVQCELCRSMSLKKDTKQITGRIKSVMQLRMFGPNWKHVKAHSWHFTVQAQVAALTWGSGLGIVLRSASLGSRGKKGLLVFLSARRNLSWNSCNQLQRVKESSIFASGQVARSICRSKKKRRCWEIEPEIKK